jgi:hypothetical protein
MPATRKTAGVRHVARKPRCGEDAGRLPFRCIHLLSSMAKIEDIGFENLGFETLSFEKPGLRDRCSSPVLTLKSGHWFCLKCTLTLLIRGRHLCRVGDRREFMVGALCGLRAPG